MDTELTGVWPAGMTGMGQRSTILVECLLGMNICHGASWSWVAVLTCAGLWAPLAQAYTIASEDARPGSAALPSPLLGPPTQQPRLPKVVASVSELKGIGILRLDPPLTLSAIIVGTLKEASTTTAVQRVGYRCMLRPTSYSLAHTCRVLTTTARSIMSAPPARRKSESHMLTIPGMADCIVKWCVHSPGNRLAVDRGLLMCLRTVNRQQVAPI
jgi:hypothetical protein